MPTTAFVTKLRFLVDDPKFDEAISWTEDGLSIVIRNVEYFVDRVLCTTFKTSNFSSFVRQLNMYGFNKVNGYTKLVNGRRPPMIFRSCFFMRDKPELMMSLKRMPLKNKDRRTAIATTEDSEVMGETELTIVHAKEEHASCYNCSCLRRSTQACEHVHAEELRMHHWKPLVDVHGRTHTIWRAF